MKKIYFSLIYFIFFLSGAAALIYEIVWVRYLSLVFGGSHLAVTTVLAVFMGGLALGSFIIGKKVGSVSKLLRMYGFLELGIALSAFIFKALIHFYPLIYIPLAQVAATSPLYLSFIRIMLSIVVLIIPTTLMGGTLPLLSAFVSRRIKGVGSHLSFLYGFNTLGAVVGAGAAGFVLLPNVTVGTTLWIAVLINVLVGTIAILLQNTAKVVLEQAGPGEGAEVSAAVPDTSPGENQIDLFSLKLVLWGIGVSGFCALGYEVLWTRILSIVIGASVYGFALLLMAFLTGIALGSSAYGLFLRVTGEPNRGTGSHPARSVLLFGLIQIIIGMTALFVSLHILDLPTRSIFLYNLFRSPGLAFDPFKARQMANFVLAFSFMFIPAFFMGVAFPLAGKIHAEYRKLVGRAVGEVLFYNTIGAILGSAVTGFVLIYLFGIQTALQVLILINTGFGLLVLGSVLGRKSVNWAVAGATTAAIMLLAAYPAAWHLWDTKYYAIYQSNKPELFSTPEKIRQELANQKVLYYGEGAQSIVSSILAGDTQFFITNGRVEASSTDEGMQCQYTLGHLPMLLNKNPKKVFVLGTGSGMTLGATSVHPEVEQITLAEIEPKVLGVARTFGIYNHNVLDNPKIRIVFNDGRNFLMTTKEKFDVITADPIHPWFSGAGYLYSTSYFKLAAQHLNPGGIACQWLPIYELTGDNLKSVVSTFRENFAYTMVWLTHDDAELVGSNAPIIISEKDLERRIKVPEVLQDLRRVKMGSAEDFLSYFVMGDRGTKAYSSGARVNTDDNLYLEFSAPLSIGKGYLTGMDVAEIVRYRESIVPYLQAPADAEDRARHEKKWAKNLETALLVDQAHVLNLLGKYDTPEYDTLMGEVGEKNPTYAPWRFLVMQTPVAPSEQPRQIKVIALDVADERGKLAKILFTAVMVKEGEGKTTLFFVDNHSRIIFGKTRILGNNKNAYIIKNIDDIVTGVQGLYDQAKKTAGSQGQALPNAAILLSQIKAYVESKID